MEDSELQIININAPNQLIFIKESMLERTYKPVDSPFLEKARHCYLNRRRHSKKIRKLAASIRTSGGYTASSRKDRSQRDPENNMIVNLLSDRKIPDFLLEIVRKKRIWNIGCIRKMAFCPVTEGESLSLLPLIHNQCRRQEQELKAIFEQNEARFEQRRQITHALRLARKNTAVTAVPQHNSSTLSLDSHKSEDSDRVSYFEQMEQSQSSEPMDQRNNLFEFEQQPVNFANHNLDEDNLFIEMF